MVEVMLFLPPPLQRPAVFIRVLHDRDDSNAGKYTCEVVGGPQDGLKLTEQTFRLYAQGYATLAEIHSAQSSAAYLDEMLCRTKPPCE